MTTKMKNWTGRCARWLTHVSAALNAVPNWLSVGWFMKTSDIMEGETYLAANGDWLFLVEDVKDGKVWYTVIQNKKRCQTTVANFVDRVVRRVRNDN